MAHPVSSAAGAVAGRGALDLQQQIDDAASFHLLVTAAGASGSLVREGAHAVGFAATEAICRLGLTLDLPSASGVAGTNAIGEQVGETTLRWIFVDRGFVATPGVEPAGIPLDPSQSQRFVMQEAIFRFASGDAFRAFGTGRLFPMTDDRDRPRLVVGALGEILEGTGCFRNRAGNFTIIGEIAPGGTFSGQVMVRVLDFERTLRQDAVPPPQPIGAGEDGITYLTWVAQKGSGADQENTFSLTPSGQPRGLNIPVQLKRVWTDFAVNGGLRGVPLRTGEVIGREIGFGREARPRGPGMGTALTPFQFEGVSRYSFYGPGGQTVGTLTANVLEGRSIQVRLPGAPDQPALRFGYFGPIVCGTGCFSNIRGMLYGTAGSVFAPPPAPHVITNLYVARLFDAEGRWRSPRVPSRGAVMVVPHARPERKPDPTFLPLIANKDRFTRMYKQWRAGMQACADRFGATIAETYNQHRRVGEFVGWEMDPDALRGMLQSGGVKPFDERSFNRYTGRAKGIFRTYTLDSHEEVAAAPLYSYWDPVNFTRPDGRIYKQIVGSTTGYYMPDSLPDLSDGKVDLLVNSWRPDVGVTSWIDIYQQRRHVRTSFAYKLPGPDEILWFVKDLWIDGQEIRNDVFMASHEWKERLNGRICYLMVAIFFELDFERRRIDVHGETFWRVRYEEA